MLLDVLAQRKTEGSIRGTVLVDGRPPPLPVSFQRSAGYYEQLDVHEPFTTVREAMEFSALPQTVERHTARRSSSRKFPISSSARLCTLYAQMQIFWMSWLYHLNPFRYLMGKVVCWCLACGMSLSCAWGVGSF